MGKKKRNKLVRRMKKSVPGVMKRDKVERVRSIHNAQEILEEDGDDGTVKKVKGKRRGRRGTKKKSVGSDVGSDLGSEENVMGTVKLAFSADSADRRRKKREKYGKLKGGKGKGKGKGKHQSTKSLD